MNKKVKTNENRAVTLIALVITIIVLLILAGITLNLTLGENGLLKHTEYSKDEYNKSRVKEELELVIADLKTKNVGKNITDEEIEEKLTQIGAIVIDKTGGIIGEYNDYSIQIDENRKVTVGEKLEGKRPTGTVNIVTQGEVVDVVELQVIASIQEGEIESIEAIDGAVLKESINNSATEKRFQVIKNGEYHFKITGTNKRIAIVGIKVSKITELSDLLKEIGKIEQAGVQTVKMNVKETNGTIIEKSYSLNVITYKGNLELNGINEVEGATLSNKTYCFGKVDDVAKGITSSQLAKNAVVLKVDGNLIINEGVTLTSVASKEGYGGPKGLFLYVTGELINNGIVSMSEKGAYADGEDVYLWRNINKIGTSEEYEYIPKNGANGAIGIKTSTSTYQKVYPNINNAQGRGRQTAGGASGGAGKIGSSIVGVGGNGGNGTSYSGGAGRWWYSN